jgi:aryl-alcohol dehydrogenase-like predicted oxidoreductase
MHKSAIGEQQAVATIHSALDCGLNFIDTAPAYGADGEAERLVGAALRDRRDEAVIAPKASGPTLSAAEIAADCEASLRRLRADVIDLYQIHWPKRVVPLAETLEAMNRLVSAGKVRLIGVCNFGPIDLAESFAHARPVTDQVAYSLLTRAPEMELIPACRERGVGMLCYSPLAQGLLCGKYASADEVPEERSRSRHFKSDRSKMARHGEAGCEAETFAAVARVREIAGSLNLSMGDLSVAWLLHQPAVTSVLTGASTPEQVRANARCADIKLSPETLRALDEATAGLKRAMGSSLDLWEATPRSRIR